MLEAREGDARELPGKSAAFPELSLASFGCRMLDDKAMQRQWLIR